jgi:predicted Zn-dependent protease with MMP-like domain
MELSEFEKLVDEAIASLPQNIRGTMKNVAILVENDATSDQLRRTGTRRGSVLLGLYQGVPETSWGKGFGGHLPDKITIFKNAIEMFAKTKTEIKELAKMVVWHEIAHHFGVGEKEVRKLEKKWLNGG